MIVDPGTALAEVGVEPEVCAKEAFGTEFLAAIRPLRAALLRLLEEWGSPETPKEFQRTAGVGWTICWQVFRIVKAEDLAAEAKHAPTPASLKRLLAAAGKAGVSRETIEAVKGSAEEFAGFTKRMAADRAAFESMVAGLVPEESGEKISLSHRRAAYRAMSNIMGRQTELVYSSVVVKRSETGEGTDGLMYQVQRGVTRFRADSRIRVYAYNRNPSGTPGAVQVEGALDAESAERYGMPILPQFSSVPFPRANKKMSPKGDVTYWIDGTEIGARGAFNVAIGRVGRNMPLMVDEDGMQGGQKLFHLTVGMHKPVAVTVQELVVHRPSFPKSRVEMMVYSSSEGGGYAQSDVRELQQYAIEERVTNLGRADRVGISEFPEYGEMLRQGTETVGWDLSEFDVWRVKMPYPIMTSATRLYFYV